jgi:hypothetical protein
MPRTLDPHGLGVCLIISPRASWSGEAPCEQLDTGDEEPGLRALDGGLEVPDEAAIAVEPMSAQHATENLTIHHKVADYATWRAGYDAHEKSRTSAGITNGRAFRSAEDPNDVVVLLDVADVAKARAWLGSDDLKAAMQKSGVVGSASIRFAT